MFWNSYECADVQYVRVLLHSHFCIPSVTFCSLLKESASFYVLYLIDPCCIYLLNVLVLAGKLKTAPTTLCLRRGFV